MSKKSQKRGKCIFCGSEGLTKQHVFPDWLKEYFPRSEKDMRKQFSTFFKYDKGTIIATPKFRRRTGHLGTTKVRNVCGNCNNGWMSRLEQEAKPIIVELLKGNVIALDKTKQELLSRWIMLVNIMIEYTDVKTMAIPQEDKELIMNGKLPHGWKIWICYSHSKKWDFSFRHHGAKILSQQDYENGREIPEQCNVQFTTIGIGDMYIHAIKSCEDFYNPTIVNYEEKGLIQICPYIRDIPITLRQHYISDEAAEIIPDLFVNDLMNHNKLNPDKAIIDMREF